VPPRVPSHALLSVAQSGEPEAPLRRRRRRPTVIALIALAPLLLSPNAATGPHEGRKPATGSHDAQEARFGFADVQHLARERAAHEYRRMPEALPAEFASLTEGEYRSIRFRPESALWHGQALFEVQFFQRGFHNRQRVNIFEVSAAGVRPVDYDPRFFSFGRPVKLPKATAGIGYAGLRVHYPLQTPDYKDELVAFLGASYFRVLGRNEHYGASARALAIDTALPAGEEFPAFTDFWLVRPEPTARTLTIYALLDSPSVAGAYEFQIRPGGITQVEVHCVLFTRRAIAKLGIAPLTSMFLYGAAGDPRHFDDYRPEVHDSDGFMTETGRGQWIWRPLVNPRELRVNRFMDDNPRGFGLIQRQRDFSRYEDALAQYELRPGYWEEPLGGWGKGGVELVEIPSDQETHDNIVAYWVPEHPPAPRRPLSFSYVLFAYLASPDWPPGGRVIATRSGTAHMAPEQGHFAPGSRRFLVDFAGGDLDGLAATQPVKAEARVGNAQLESLTVQRIPESGAWRAALVVAPSGKKPVDLQCYLTLDGEVLSETWVYQWTP
jgi:periplasmic glucans biosynthesis protein